MTSTAHSEIYDRLSTSLEHTQRAASDLYWEANRQKGEKDQVYLERNHLVAALARLFPSGTKYTNIEDWNPEWHGCVYIDLPSGQISYHFHDSHTHLFAGLPPYQGEYDGHSKDDVHRRLAALKTWSQP